MDPQKLYNKHYNIFLDFLKNTTQKKVLVKNIKKILKKRLKTRKYEKFIFTDIGAGDGRVTKEIIEFLKLKLFLKVNFIEPSKELINIFKKNCDYKEISFINKKFQEIKIPKSDFILSSHSIYYSDNFLKFIESIYCSLNDFGVALIVKNNLKSEDNLLRKKLRTEKRSKSRKFFNIIKYLDKKKVKYISEIVESEIEVKNCFKLNKEGKAVISFLYKKPFEDITEKEIKKLQSYLKKNTKNNKLIKKEDYIWIYK